MLLAMIILFKKKKIVVEVHPLICNIITKDYKLFHKLRQLQFENHQ
jgi:hypothetical protein